MKTKTEILADITSDIKNKVAVGSITKTEVANILDDIVDLLLNRGVAEGKFTVSYETATDILKLYVDPTSSDTNITMYLYGKGTGSVKIKKLMVETSVLPESNNQIDLGSETYKFKDAYIEGNIENDEVQSSIANYILSNL